MTKDPNKMFLLKNKHEIYFKIEFLPIQDISFMVIWNFNQYLRVGV